MSIWSSVRAYLRYRRKSVSKHGVHSPFVFDLITKTLPGDSSNNIIFSAEKWRADCLASSESISVTDFGTGKSGLRTISSIAKRAGKSPKEGRLLYRLVKRFQPNTILELGTSLGISAQYMRAGAPDAKFITIEGCPETARIANEGFKKSDVQIDIRVGNFADVLPGVLEEIKSLDFIYIDGNHRKQPTLDYFAQARKYAHNDTVFIFDDIHWSLEMEEAWKIISADPDLHVTLDLFHFGVVIARKEQIKEHFILKW